MFGWFTKKRDPVKPLPPIHPEREAQFITIEAVKGALSENDFAKIVDLFELFLDRDLKIAEGVEKRQNALVSLIPQIHAGAKEQAVIDRVFQKVGASEWLLSLSDAIYYGYSLIEMDFVADEGMLIPQQITHHAATRLRYDSDKRRHYLVSRQGKQLPIESLAPRLVMYAHARPGDDIQNRALAYKLLYYALLKHVTIGYNVQFFDSLAVPPIVVHSTDLSDKEQLEALKSALMALKSNSYGIFPAGVEVENLKVSSQADFLGLIEYFDGLIAQYLVGATSISDGKAGSLALAKQQEERFQEKVRFDAARIQDGLAGILNTILSLNLSHFDPVTVTLPVERPVRGEEFASIVEKLSRGGYEVAPKEIEERLGLTLVPKKVTETNKKEFNATNGDRPADDNAGALSSEVSPPPLPMTYQEQLLDAEPLEPLEAEIAEVQTILKACSSYEEALAQIEAWDNPRLEEALRRLIAANRVIGALE